jgi:hypothetical protein
VISANENERPDGLAVVWVSVAVLVIVPEEAFTVTVMVAVVLAPFARAPTVQVTVPELLEMVPVALEEET